MYKKQRNGWFKHIDFILLDAVILQLAFIVAYMIRHGITDPYRTPMYRNMGVILLFVNLIVGLWSNAYSGILRRGYYIELFETFKLVTITIAVVMMYMFWTQQSADYSRMTFGMLWVIGVLGTWLGRITWKAILRKRNTASESGRSMILISGSKMAEEFTHTFITNNFENIRANGLVVWDNEGISSVGGVPIVANKDTVIEYLRANWVDEIMIDRDSIPESVEEIDVFIAKVMEMGITVHTKIAKAGELSKNQTVENIGGYTVLTGSVAMVTARQLMLKRFLDILGGLVGCIFTVIAFVFVAPIIKIKSPGPVFFKQTRVGKNGRQFTLYKFRSMYMDAEERKREMLSQNELNGDMMFKLKEDPRVIKGIGNFIRKYSIDELPQFYNVLIGDMSLVGTRPPTVDEWEKYELHHRKRLAIKPGMTGMWQVSGRSSIKDFEQVVELDTKYILNWSVGLDLRILFKTIGVVFKGDGAM